MSTLKKWLFCSSINLWHVYANKVLASYWLLLLCSNALEIFKKYQKLCLKLLGLPRESVGTTKYISIFQVYLNVACWFIALLSSFPSYVLRRFLLLRDETEVVLLSAHYSRWSPFPHSPVIHWNPSLVLVTCRCHGFFT